MWKGKLDSEEWRLSIPRVSHRGHGHLLPQRAQAICGDSVLKQRRADLLDQISLAKDVNAGATRVCDKLDPIKASFNLLCLFSR